MSFQILTLGTAFCSAADGPWRTGCAWIKSFGKYLPSMTIPEIGKSPAGEMLAPPSPLFVHYHQ